MSPNWEPMPGRVFDFTAEQSAEIRAIEELCHAEVIVLAPIPGTLQCAYEGFLSRPLEYRNEDSCMWREENGELSYIRDAPTAGVMPEEELRRYPRHIRCMLPTEKYDIGSYNVVPTLCGGTNVDSILQRLRSFTVLLEMGWHLGREADFDDPYTPEPEPRSEEARMWEDYEEYLKEKNNAEDLTELSSGDIF